MAAREEGEKDRIRERPPTEASPSVASPFARCHSAPPSPVRATYQSVRVPTPSAQVAPFGNGPLAGDHGHQAAPLADVHPPAGDPRDEDPPARPPSVPPPSQSAPETASSDTDEAPSASADATEASGMSPPPSAATLTETRSGARHSVRYIRFAAIAAATLCAAAVLRVFVTSSTSNAHETPHAGSAPMVPSVAVMAAPTHGPAVSPGTTGGASASASPSPSAAVQPDPAPSVAATAPATAPTGETAAPTRFRRATATAALNELAPELTDCRIPKGRSGKVEVIFEPDGHISSAKPLDAYVGTFGGKCVATHLKKARVPPFRGAATPFTYVFVIPDRAARQSD